MTNRLIPVAIIGLIIIAVGGYFGLQALDKSRLASTRDALANGYATQSLTTPFKLHSRIWVPQTGPYATSGEWVYTYTTNLSETDTLAAAKDQLGRGAYQVVASKPDVIGQNHAILYRDLITEDVALTAQIGPEGEPDSTIKNPPAGPTTVVVTLTSQSGQ